MADSVHSSHKAESTEHGKDGPTVIHDYTTRIRFKKHELGGGFAVLIFLGEVPDDPSQWRTSHSFVGLHVAFVSSAASGYGNRSDKADSYSEGFVHLNSAIAKRSGLSSYELSEVLPYLKENLHWRIQSTDRSAVELEKLPSLEVTVSQTPLTQAPGTLFPIPGKPTYHHDVTYGRPGGARHLQT
ncbi:hypothetical protein BC827DRAFT_1120059 [Russula dissimulans]|nr:hypothetical protein BC827DRAFT_1120059 [Russula dissimulans]